MEKRIELLCRGYELLFGSVARLLLGIVNSAKELKRRHDDWMEWMLDKKVDDVDPIYLQHLIEKYEREYMDYK